MASKNLDNLELKERSAQITDAMVAFLPGYLKKQQKFRVDRVRDNLLVQGEKHGWS